MPGGFRSMEQAATFDDTAQTRLHLGGFVLDLADGELRRADGQLAGLRRQALAVLLVLGSQAGRVVGKDELMRRVWPGVVVGDDSLAQAIAEIRRVLGDSEHRRVRTVARRGYLLMPDEAAPGPAPDPVDSAAAPSPASASASASPPARQRIVFAAALLVLAAAIAGFVALGPWRSTAPPAVPLRSLVVLPLDSEAGADEQAWFADALTGDLTRALTVWRTVSVIGRGTAARYKGRSDDPRAVARELGVRYVVHGRVRRDGEQVRLEMNLIDGDTGVAQWAEQYQIERAQLAQSVDDIRGGISRTLLVEIGRSVGQRTARMKPEAVEADDLAMQGTSVMLRAVGPDNFTEALRLFEQALAKDPDSVRGLGGVVNVQAMRAIFRWTDDPEAAVRRAEQAQTRLETLDPTSFAALDGRATLTNWRGDWPGLLKLSEVMIAHFPSDHTSHHHRCSALLRLGRFEESVPSCERALRISPRDSRVPIWHGLIGMNRFMQGRYAEAAERARLTVGGLPHLPFYWLLLAASLERDGQSEEARRVWADFRARHPTFALTQATSMWPATQPDFVAGRDVIVATVRPFDSR
ncbi:winged helix-turn-helix domain-containing tetratricopeptide repeat protein [Variovorax sp. LjRoot84]|uniref:winged helix-turn-helix domain-containing tetratricopeptide repeat protein n=1 Tax=Variovorax sp. LjRoot84 TaxID=3342340 RepID=UPI003F510286